ncbi:MAG: hypothetical protein ACI8RD_008441 [Bacillariaceae sp.]|jgi:hypothetical protein
MPSYSFTYKSIATNAVAAAAVTSAVIPIIDEVNNDPDDVPVTIWTK